MSSSSDSRAAPSSISRDWCSPTNRFRTHSGISNPRWVHPRILRCIRSTASRSCSTGPTLQPKDVRARARMNPWISAVNSYYYPYMIYHVSHERRVFPELGIPSDEKVVAHALPKIEVGLQVLERELGHGKDHLLGSDLTLADFYVLPSTYAFGLTKEGQAMYPRYPAFCRWRERMEAHPTVRKFRAALPPHAPIEHARQWAASHRPKY